MQLAEAAKVKRVRGVAYGTKVSPQICNRLVDASRGVLNHFLPDVWVYTDVFKGKTSGLSAGFALTLVAETTSGVHARKTMTVSTLAVCSTFMFVHVPSAKASTTGERRLARRTSSTGGALRARGRGSGAG